MDSGCTELRVHKLRAAAKSLDERSPVIERLALLACGSETPIEPLWHSTKRTILAILLVVFGPSGSSIHRATSL